MRHTLVSPARRRLSRAGLALALSLAGAVIVQPTAAFAATSTLTVSTTADIAAGTGACGDNSTTPPSPLSFREATCLADNISLSTGNSVTINVPPGTYNLTSGELQIGANGNSTITITGAGAGSTVVNGGGTSRVFDLDPNIIGGLAVSMSGLTVTGGSDGSFGGGGIIGGSASATAADTLTLNAVTVTNNASAVGAPAATNKFGGGIQFVGGSLTITNSTISNNTSNSSPGTGVAYGAQGSAPGEHLAISNTTFSGNYGTNAAGTSQNNGGALYVKTAVGGISYDVTNSRFVNNTITSTTGGATGAAILATTGILNVSGSTFTGNSVSGGTVQTGGAIQVDNTTANLHYNRFTGNVAGTGSALASTASTVDATDNWWGCNSGPGTTGCDTVSGAATVSPRLILVASASPDTIVGPNATSTITAGFTTDSLDAAVGGAQLTAFAGQAVQWQDPQPGNATVSASATTIASGSATTTYNSRTSTGPGHVLASFDNATATAAITVDQAPAITSANTAAFNIGQAGSLTVTTTGYPNAAITKSGTLPSGLTFVDNGDGTATLSGTPAAGSAGTYPLSLTAANGVNPNATQTLTVTVGQPPAFTSPTTATFTAGSAGSFGITTSGSPTATVTSTGGTLPSGLTFTAGAGGTATISGTPAAGTGGTYSVTLSATNGVDPNATQTLTLTVQQAPAVTTNPSSQTVNPGASVTFSAAASGYPTPTVQWQRSTNGGASFSNIADATSTSYTFTAAGGDSGNQYRAVFTNAVSSATSTAATLTVGSAPTINSANTTTFEVGTAGSFSVTTSGFPNPALTTSGTLPAWLTFADQGNGTATLTGTPPMGASGSYTFTVLANNGFNPSDSQTFILNVNESPTITSTNHATFTVGASSSFAIITSAGFPVATTVTESGTLPSGITFTADGGGGATLSGTPAAGTGGSYPITISASATGGTTATRTQSFTLVINEPPSITSADNATFTVGQAGSFTVQTAGGQPSGPGDITLTESGALPGGVTFTDQGDGTAVLSGTPAVDTGGSYPLTITASNGVGPNATQSFTLTVRQPPRFTSTDNTAFTLGAAASFTVTTSSGVPATPVTISVTDPTALPAGITLADQGDGTAILGGTPTAGGVFHISLKASNGVAPDPTQSFTITVNEAPSITSADHATFTVGTAGSFTVTTNPGTPPETVLTQSGALPDGVSFTDSGDGTAVLSGTPAAGTGGVYALTISAKNAGLPASTQSFTLTVNEAPSITSAATTTFVVGTAGSFTVTTTAGYPAATTVAKVGAGALPTGVTLVDQGDGTAVLSGTPAAGSGGSYPITIRASNADGSTDQAFTLKVLESPTITSADHVTFTVGTAGTFTVTTTAGTPPETVLTESGALPDGVSFTDSGDGTAVLSGTPAAGTGGVYALTISAKNAGLPASTQSFTLTVDEAPTFTSVDGTTFLVGSAGQFTVSTTAGYPSATTLTQVSTEPLPAGVTLVDQGDDTAVLSGTPAAGTGGSYPITIRATNSQGSSDQSFTLTVLESATITSADHATFTAGTEGTFTFTTSGGYPAPAQLSATGSLPDGVTFEAHADGTATLSGTATAGGVYLLTVTASNGATPAALKVRVTKGVQRAAESARDTTRSFTLTVNGPPTITSEPKATFTAGLDSTFTVTTLAGVPAATTLTETGPLPAGIIFTAGSDGTATLSGTAPVSALGTYPITLTASNGVDPDATQTFELTIGRVAAVSLPNALPSTGGSLSGVPSQTHVGQVLHISGSGFAAGAPVTLGLYSPRTALGTAVADEAGDFTATITLPRQFGAKDVISAGVGADGADLYLGAHTVIRAVPGPAPVPTPPAEPIVPSGGGTVVGGTVVGGSGGDLANTGPDTDPRLTAGYAGMLMITGCALLFLSRRRRRAGEL